MLNELLKITKKEIGGALTETVDAKELYKGLEVKSKFYDWITRRISKTLFQEDHDYTVLKSENLKNRGVSLESKDYIMSIEMAKHLAMMENTPRGYQVRGYFIECETSLKET